MWGWKQSKLSAEQRARLDQLSDDVVRSLAVSPEQIEQTANSPFLLRRLQVRIEAEKQRRANPDRHWVFWLLTARQAVPALTLVAILAATWFWSMPQPSGVANGDEIAASADANALAVVSTDDAIASVIGWD